MKFYLGTHMVHWLWTLDVPLFMSQRRLIRNKVLKPALSTWALDSGGFSELSMYGAWKTSPTYYLDSIVRYHEHIGKLDWAAPQDWMCEPFILAKTGKSIQQHQEYTIDSYLYLSNKSPVPIIPILQGYSQDDYERHVELYYKRGIDLTQHSTVGIGSVCRRQDTSEIHGILKHFSYLKLHGFGVKSKGLRQCSQYLVSADSLSWSFQARYDAPLPQCTHNKCSSCIQYAVQWRNNLLLLINSPVTQSK